MAWGVYDYPEPPKSWWEPSKWETEYREYWDSYNSIEDDYVKSTHTIATPRETSIGKEGS